MSDSSNEHESQDGPVEVKSAAATLFDLRTVIAILFGTYGVLLVVISFFATSQAELDKAGGVRLNLWSGLVMIVVSAGFLAWVKLSPPLGTPPSQTEPGDAPGPTHH